jgi:hypothetical protein
MSPIVWDRKEIATIVAILMLSCAAAFLSVRLTRPRPFGGAAMTVHWQCNSAPGNPAACSRMPG